MKTGLQSVTDRKFDQTVESSRVPVLVEFWKPGCGHCRALSAELELLQEDFGRDLLILTMNVEENPQISAELDIISLPALALYRNGQFKAFIGGLGRREEILRRLESELA